jgi:hypothetical protein
MIAHLDTMHGVPANLIPVADEAEAARLAGPDATVYASKIVPQLYLVLPPSVIIEPAQEVNAPTRRLPCYVCGGLTVQSLIRRGAEKYYVCECGTECRYLIVRGGGEG